jgi:hypothetical protein
VSPRPLRLRLLVPTPRVEGPDGETLDLPAGKPLAMLAYLHVAGRPTPRDTLATLLWPAASHDRARASVRQAVWLLRQRLGDDLFDGDDPLSIAPGRLVSDMQELRAQLQAGNPIQAARAWDAPPFGSLSVPDAPEWERWSDAIRLELEAHLGGALADAGNAARDPTRGREGVEALELACRVQPARLQHHLDLAGIHLDLRAFDEAGSVLARARALFDDPRSATILQELSERKDAMERGAATGPADGALRLDFVGRSEEFAGVLRRWRQARSGAPGITVVLGEAGIGKTRLAEEIRLVAEAEGGRSIFVKAEDSERPIEWGLLGEVISRLLRLSGAAGISPASDGILRSLMPSLAHADPPREDGSVRALGLHLPRTSPSAALSDALIDLVTAVSDDAPLLLVVDDLHWADTESRTVLTRVATRLDRASSLLLFTCRSREGEGRLGKTLKILTEAPSSTTLELDPWSVVELEEALAPRIRFSNPREGDALVRRLHRTSRGNPLFVLELLKAFGDEGILEVQPDGTAIFRTERLPADRPLPGSVRALVDRQLDQLSKEATLVAAHMARIGHATSPRVLGLQTGLGTSAVTNGIGELLARRLIRWEGTDSLTFVHDELRAAVARRYQLHVGLTAGGGAQWSLFRSAVVVSFVILLVGAAAYAITNPDPFGPGPWGGGLVEITTADGATRSFRIRGSASGGLEPVDRLPAAHPGRTAVRPLGNGTFDLHLAVHPSTGTAPGPGLAVLPDPPALAVLSPDHRFVAVATDAGLDSVRILTEGGRTHAAFEAGEVLALDWCGPRALYLLAREGPGIVLRNWSVDDGSLRSLELGPVTPGSALACAPDERALLLAGARDGRAGIFLHDFATGSTTPVAVPGDLVPVALRWHASRPRPVPVELLLPDAEPVRIGLGGQRALDALLVLEGGTRRRESLAWSSDNPEVVAVGNGGRLTAVGPGTTLVRARWGSWLEAAVPVEVASTAEAVPLLSLDDSWILPVGSPLVGEAGPLVDLGPDAGFALVGGPAFTVEFDVALPTAPGSLELCVREEGTPGARGCVRAFPPDGAGRLPALGLATGRGFPDTRVELRGWSSDWVPMALVVDAEGWARLFVRGRLRAEGALRLPRQDSEAWLLELRGWSGEGGEGGALRRLRTWEGERSGIEGEVGVRRATGPIRDER